MPTIEINIGFTKEELQSLSTTLLPLLQHNRDESDSFDHARLAQLSGAIKIALAESRFDEFKPEATTFFEKAQQLNGQRAKNGKD